MATRYARMEVVKLSGLSSAVGLAAYQSRDCGERELVNEAVYDFRHKPGLQHHEMLLPEGAPERYRDWSVLWNEVELKETTKDRLTKEVRIKNYPGGPQLGYNMVMGLPKEMTDEQRLDLAKTFCKRFTDAGHAVQLDIHSPDKDNDNYHFHLLVTGRRVTADGLGNKIENFMGAQFYKGSRFSNDPEENLDNVWAKFQEDYCRERDIDLDIPGRRLESRGREISPDVGIKAEAEKYEIDRAALLADPRQIAHDLAANKGHFTARDVDQLCLKYRFSLPEERQIRAAIAVESISLINPGGPSKASGLVFTTRPIWEEQREGIDRLKRLGTTQLSVDFDRDVLDRPAKFDFTDEQKAAMDLMVSDAQFVAIRGAAGTGKSTIMNRVGEALDEKGTTRILLAPSNLVASDARKEGWSAETINTFVYEVERGQRVVPDVIFLDEAAMTDGRMLSRLGKIVEAQGVKLVSVGDEKQLESVQLAGMWAAVRKEVPTCELTKVIRQKVDVEARAAEKMGAGGIEAGLRVHLERGNIKWGADQAGQIQMAADMLYADPSGWDQKVALSATNKGCDDLNKVVQAKRLAAGEISDKIQKIDTDRGVLMAARGDRILIRENGRRPGRGQDRPYSNGDVGTLIGVGRDGMTVRLDRDDKQVFIPFRDHKGQIHTPKVSLAYAVTNHKSQGKTLDAVYLLHSASMSSAQLDYVGATRHRLRFGMVVDKSLVPDAKALFRKSSRDRSQPNLGAMVVDEKGLRLITREQDNEPVKKSIKEQINNLPAVAPKASLTRQDYARAINTLYEAEVRDTRLKIWDTLVKAENAANQETKAGLRDLPEFVVPEAGPDGQVTFESFYKTMEAARTRFAKVEPYRIEKTKEAFDQLKAKIVANGNLAELEAQLKAISVKSPDPARYGAGVHFDAWLKREEQRLRNQLPVLQSEFNAQKAIYDPLVKKRGWFGKVTQEEIDAKAKMAEIKARYEGVQAKIAATTTLDGKATYKAECTARWNKVFDAYDVEAKPIRERISALRRDIQDKTSVVDNHYKRTTMPPAMPPAEREKLLAIDVNLGFGAFVKEVQSVKDPILHRPSPGEVIGEERTWRRLNSLPFLNDKDKSEAREIAKKSAAGTLAYFEREPGEAAIFKRDNPDLYDQIVERAASNIHQDVHYELDASWTKVQDRLRKTPELKQLIIEADRQLELEQQREMSRDRGYSLGR